MCVCGTPSSLMLGRRCVERAHPEIVDSPSSVIGDSLCYPFAIPKIFHKQVSKFRV